MNTTSKWVFITGASRGIGRLIAKYMAEKDFNLILHSRKLSGTDDLTKELSQFPIEIKQVAAELSDSSAVDTMLKEIDQFNVPVGIIFNNAGYQVAYRTDCFTTPDSDYTTSFAINTIAPMKICYHFLPKMMEANYGRIINTTSGIIDDPQQAGYSASKYALNRVTVDLSHKVTDYDISLTLVDPGWCRTELGSMAAPNPPESALPGVVLAAFASAEYNGTYISAQNYSNLSIDEALIELKHTM